MEMKRKIEKRRSFRKRRRKENGKGGQEVKEEQLKEETGAK